MILYKRFPYGGLGNALFQYAYLRALSFRTGEKLALPMSPIFDYFNMNPEFDNNIPIDREISEESYDFSKNNLMLNITGNVNFFGYFQSEKYFEDVWNEIKGDFEIKIRDKFKGICDGDDYCVHVRKGDYRNNKHYIDLPSEYYGKFFEENKDKHFYIFSDDYTYCKKHFTQPNVFFMDGHSAVEHLAMMTWFKNHLIANSTFSWWGVKLAEMYHKVNVMRPDGVFTLETNGRTGKDFYPERWKIRGIDRLSKPVRKKSDDRVDAKDVTFVIPVKYDHQDRMENIYIVINYLNTHFDTNIIVGEQGGTFFADLSDYSGVKYMNFSDLPCFYRTRMINSMVKEVDTPIVFNWDADVITIVPGIIDAIEHLRSDADIAYPYSGEFIRIPREGIKEMFNPDHDTSPYIKVNSVGGAVGFKKDSFIKAGMENENFQSWGYEDEERYNRFVKLGYAIFRSNCPILHMEHFIGRDSARVNPKTTINRSELRKVSNFSREELESYIKSWNWV